MRLYLCTYLYELAAFGWRERSPGARADRFWSSGVGACSWKWKDTKAGMETSIWLLEVSLASNPARCETAVFSHIIAKEYPSR
jgi:hypothetical protein